MKKLLTAFFSSLPIIFFGVMLLIVVLIFGGSNQKEEIGGGDEEFVTNGIAPEIERLRHVFEKYARKEGVYDQLNIIMALTMQESGGRYLDIMQSSESIGLPPNTITNPEYSIQVGIKHFAAVYKKSRWRCSVNIAVLQLRRGLHRLREKTWREVYKSSCARI